MMCVPKYARWGDVKALGSSLSWHAYVPAALLVTIGIIGLAGASVTAPGGSGRYLVVGAPGVRMADMVNMVSAADGRLIERGRFSNIAIAWSDSADFAAATRRSGAWLAIAAPDGGGCYGSSAKETL